MKKANMMIRIILGLFLIVFALNKFFNFIPMEHPPADSAAGLYFAALFSVYIMPWAVGIIELIAGILLISGRLVPLALAIMLPVTVNILMFHLTLDPANVGGGAIIAILQGYLLYAHRERFYGIICDNCKAEETSD